MKYSGGKSYSLVSEACPLLGNFSKVFLSGHSYCEPLALKCGRDSMQDKLLGQCFPTWREHHPGGFSFSKGEL